MADRRSPAFSLCRCAAAQPLDVEWKRDLERSHGAVRRSSRCADRSRLPARIAL